MGYSMYRLFRHTFGDQAFNDVWMNDSDESFTGGPVVGGSRDIRTHARQLLL